MANVLLYNLAAMTVASTGTGTITLGAPARIGGVLFLSFAAAGISNGDTVAYSILDPTGQSEVGFGIYTSSGTTLTRNPTTSTNANAAINMSAASIVKISARLQDIGTPGQRPATTTNDNAASGNAGEYITASASGVALTSSIVVNITSISLTPGDWDVTGFINYTGNAATVVLRTETSVSAASATSGNSASFYAGNTTYFGTVNGSGFQVSAPVTRFTISTTSSIFLTTLASFTVNTMAGTGTISARRVR